MGPKNEYGLMIERRFEYGTERVNVHLVRKEEGRDFPLGCSSSGESFYYDNVPKHLVGLNLDGLGMYGFVSEYEGEHFLGGDVEYQNVHSMDESKLKRMIKTIARVNRRIEKDRLTESGDRFMALAAAFKLTFAVERIGPSRPHPDWNWMTIVEGRNRYRRVIEEARATVIERKGGKVA